MMFVQLPDPVPVVENEPQPESTQTKEEEKEVKSDLPCPSLTRFSDCTIRRGSSPLINEQLFRQLPIEMQNNPSIRRLFQ